ncbi:WD40-repeat-containing domain protein [Naematelia encephala]|uniref:WD40-repeat-containing domain protein n=1 Tax=Naematelia encephala TaxID=71784 RepID=A0A1Y2B1S8_9TREE|nr:WD40-repeat-containing domain protein [Naematelia encephala]
MAPSVPLAYPTLSNPLPSRPYILSITPTLSSSSPHLLLRHPSPSITIADNQTLQPVEVLQGGHGGDVTDITVDESGGVWSSAKDASIVRWDERTRQPAMTIKAFVRKPLPVLAMTVSERDHLVVAGTELVSSEAHILFWDMRNHKTPAYSHASTHSDDITHLSLLPPTSSFLPSSSSFPSRLLLSTSTDGLVALSDLKEADEDEAVQAADNWGQSIAGAGCYLHRRGLKVWARSDMDGVCVWSLGKGVVEDEDGEVVEMQNPVEYGSDNFKFRDFNPPSTLPSTARSAEEERVDKAGRLTSDYLIDVAPSLGVGKHGGPMVAVGTNAGDIVLLHQSSTTSPSYIPSAFLASGPSPNRGHADVVRSIFHDVQNEALYTGSEDGVLCGWSLASLPERLRVGDPDIDDDGGDGREGIDRADEESEIESDDDDDDDDGMDVDDDDEEEGEEGPRYGPVLGRAAGDRREKRREKRVNPY